MNNPLIYTDPSGEKWYHFIPVFGPIIGAGEAINNNMGDEDWANAADGAAYLLNPFRGIATSISALDALINWDLSRMDPLKSGTIINNSNKIYQGLFAADTDQSGWGWQILSRLTWQAPVTYPGYVLANLYNTTGKVEDVETFRGVTVVPVYGFGEGSGMSMGGYMFLDSREDISLNNPLFVHEYGHFLQNRQWGPFSLPMSFQSLGSTIGLSSTRHQETFWERDANARSFNYFQNDMSPGELATYRASNYWNRRELYDNRIWRYGIPGWNGFYFFYNIHNSN